MKNSAVKKRTPHATRWRRNVLCAVSAVLCASTFYSAVCSDSGIATSLFCQPALSAEMQTTPQVILHQLNSLKQMGSVLYVAAHPDDENTELLAYLARGRDYRTAYLSLTRGDGGQNVLGADLGAKLGMARTSELLAARDIDGARQYFSRAIDFGFSKSYVETLKVWDKQAILSDVVRVIRQFKPDVIVTRFSPSPGGTHGHHTASTVLAMEAFKLAGDASAFPEQIAQGLKPWQPKRILWNVSPWQKDKIAPGDILKIDAGGRDAISGESFTDIAGASRAMHKTQGFDAFKITGVNGAPRLESFQLLDGAPATNDIMDGVDTTWQRVTGGDAIAKLIDQTIEKFDKQDAAKSLPLLLELRAKMASLPPSKDLDTVVAEKRQALDLIVQECLGLTVKNTVVQSEIVPGESVTLNHTAQIKARLPENLSVELISTNYPAVQKTNKQSIKLQTDKVASWQDKVTIPATSLVEHPWWLRQEGTPGVFGASDATLIGSAKNAPAFSVINVFKIGDQTLTVTGQPVQAAQTQASQVSTAGGAATNGSAMSFEHPLAIIAPVSLHFDVETLVLTPGQSKTVTVTVTSARSSTQGTLALDAPSGWHIAPATRQFHLDKVGQSADLQFTVTAPATPSTINIAAKATVNGVTYNSKRETITYAHIPPQMMHAPAVVRAVNLDLSIKGQNVGFIPGAGELLPENLKQMGYKVTILDDATLTDKDLNGLDAVILGVRAFNVRKNIDRAMPLLFDYVNGGGTVIVQYIRPDKLQTEKLAPYKLQINNGRVTDETAPVTFLEPESPLLNTPNKITAADFDHWVQERGLYFAEKWDDNFKPILACADSGEEQLKGSLLVANYGKGKYIYTGLSFFRELPAGVPGAYRLLANLIAAAK